jgi:hypothetical protein
MHNLEEKLTIGQENIACNKQQIALPVESGIVQERDTQRWFS